MVSDAYFISFWSQVVLYLCVARQPESSGGGIVSYTSCWILSNWLLYCVVLSMNIFTFERAKSLHWIYLDFVGQSRWCWFFFESFFNHFWKFIRIENFEGFSWRLQSSLQKPTGSIYRVWCYSWETWVKKNGDFSSPINWQHHGFRYFNLRQ